jgi:hypothetical protein
MFLCLENLREGYLHHFLKSQQYVPTIQATVTSIFTLANDGWPLT